MDGVLAHSENFQALSLLQQRYRERVNYIYTDPPFNASDVGFIYKNEYRHSSWLSMLLQALDTSEALLRGSGLVSIAIDDAELFNLGSSIDEGWGAAHRLGNLVIEIKPSGRTNDNFLSTGHEYYEKSTFPYPKSIFAVLDAVWLAVKEAERATVLDFFAGSGTTGHAVINLNREDGGQRKFILLVEMGDYFDTVLLPRIKKVTFTPEWKDGKPKRLATPEEAERSPRIVKVIRLESYEDALNNLDLKRTEAQQSQLDARVPSMPGNAPVSGADNSGRDARVSRFHEEYLLRYLLDVETRGSQSLLNIAAFTDPTAYTLKVKRPGSDESREVNVDLLETFNYLIGLTVQHIAAPESFTTEFERDSEKRLHLKGRLKQDPSTGSGQAPLGPWWFRTVTGTTPDGRKTLVIWRKRPGSAGVPPATASDRDGRALSVEQDNLVLDEWFTRQGYSSKDSEFDLIYVNGGNNLENLKAPDDTWKVRLIEEDFHRLMFEMEGV